MDGNSVQGSLDRLKDILGGRTIKDLLSNVDTKLLPQTSGDIKILNPLESVGSEKIKKPKDENKEKKKKHKKEKSDKEKDKKKSKTMRYAAGEMWQDKSMEDWPENDFRIFCGNLGNEVTDEVLSSSFRKYPSFNRAKVIRDSKTTKTKGFGFVSLQKMEDYIKAMKEMNNQYVGNRPVKLSRGKWQDRSLDAHKDEVRKKVKR